jgi:hypothetical protein
MKEILALAFVVAVVTLGTVGTIATHPWIVGAALLAGLAPGQTSLTVEVPASVATGAHPVLPPKSVAPDLWSLIVSAAQGSSCGVTAQDLAAIASVETGGTFDPSLTNASGHKGIGQFDDATWAAYGNGGNVFSPADALPAIARDLCAHGYAASRTAALDQYGGCGGPLCINGKTTYAALVDSAGAGFGTSVGDWFAQLTDAMQSWYGTPYLLGGASHAAVDCSAFVQAVFATIGVHLPRTAQTQWNAVQHVSDPRPGDLVFFQGTYPTPDTVTHIGIVIGPGLMVSAIEPTLGVQSFTTQYWQQHFYGFGRPVG